MGAVTAGEIIAEAAFSSGSFVDVHAYPAFGTERRGTPVQAYVKLSKKEKIWDRGQIENPHLIIVLDDTVITTNIFSCMMENAIALINSDKNSDYFKEKYKIREDIIIVIADVSRMAKEKDLIFEGTPIVNIGILGLIAKVFKELKLEFLKNAIRKRMGDKSLDNIDLMEDAYKLSKSL
jgi:2-oxoacid:acceptor oxidoreductase gamma subunit (pyruvate/2-ketoisovalerate family)